ncbi:MAG: GntR family transcriptional regulator [Hyphomicrobiaceae bacterium]|nr:GntR family transcriptional regulator [Hyphomicrobiaceae bacterium]MCC0010211.1 GntR family transcriptional regulator [Hyphomicrobiaceae bacterium]
MQVSAADVIREALEDEIASGHLAPGVRLDELSLADCFGVSRTPVREALRMLSASELVELKRGRSAVVATLGMVRLFELFEAMSELEGVCGRLAARRLTDEAQAALLTQHGKCRKAAAAQDAEKYYRENAVFHSLIDSAAHNRFLADELQQLRRRLRPYRRLQLRSKGRIAESFAEHEVIVKAIVDGDGEAAARAFRQHVSVQGHRFADWVARLDTTFT